VDEIREGPSDELKARSLSEFRDRIDDVVVFNALGPQDLARIADLLLEQSRRRVRAQNVELEVTAAAKRRLVELGRYSEFGAGQLRRTLQTQLDNRLAALFLEGTVEPGDTIVADVDGSGEITVGPARPEPSDAKAAAQAERESAQ
jgi:ATP-dependent Clp protease ATP-binding subunit ClpC